MTKTTLLLDEQTISSLQELVELEGRDESEVVREAISQYAATQTRGRLLPRGMGKYHSGRSDISERSEELLFDRRRPGE